MRTDTYQDKYIVFDQETYKSKNDMFSDIGLMLNILTKNGYECAFRYEDAGIYVLEFDSDDPAMGSPMIHWLDEDQLEALYSVIEPEEIEKE